MNGQIKFRFVSQLSWFVNPLSLLRNAMIFTLFILGMGAHSVSAKIIRVNQNATGPFADGTSWANAYRNLESALDVTNSSSGDEIWVAKGTYETPSLRYQLESGIKLFGGFSGSETSYSQRNIANNTVKLNSNVGGNEFHVGSNVYAMIDGFFLLMDIRLSRVTYPFQVTNCTFSGSRIQSYQSVISVTYSTFTDGRGSIGGSLELTTSPSPGSYIANCVFQGNISSVRGGAIYLSEFDVKIINCLFTENSVHGSGGQDGGTGLGGAIYVTGSGNVEILSSTFVNNNLRFSGWGLYGSAIAISGTSGTVVTVKNSLFWNNTSPEIWMNGGNLNIGNSILASGLASPSVVIEGGTLNNLGGNLIADPRFVSKSDFRLGPGSPAINGGDVSTAMGDFPGGPLLPVDLSKKPRVIGPRIDIGAYEYQSVPGPNQIPFSEDWQVDPITRWTMVTAPGEGVVSTGGGNNALCLTSSQTSANASLGSGPVNTIGFRVKAQAGGVGSNPYGIFAADGPFYDFVVLGTTLFLDGRSYSVSLVPDTWYDVRLEIDIANNQLRWFINNESTPRHTRTGISNVPISGLSIDGGGKNACWDDIYVGNEYTLTVADPANGDVTATGWTRSTPGASAKYIYRQMTSSYPVAELNAFPNLGYKLTAWTGAVSSNLATKSTVTLTMNANKSASATFGASPTYTVSRYWNGEAKPSITATENVPFNTMQNLSGTLVPPLTSFEKWEACVEPPVFPGQVILLSGNQGKVIGGNACIMAKFYDPEVRVEVRDIAVGDGDLDNMESEPRIKITNTGKVPLSDFYFEYYFHSECLNDPIPMGFEAQGLLAYDFVNMTRGNFRIVFHYTGGQPINPGASFETATGHLGYACTQSPTDLECPKKWNTSNDYSLLHSGSLFDYGETIKLPVYISDPAIAGVHPIKNTFLPTDWKFDDPAPSPDVPNKIVYTIPSSLALPIPNQYPNLITAQVFPLGNYLVNGSFENDSLGWKAYPQDITFPGGTPEDAKRLEIGLHGHDAHAFDGYRYMIVHSYDSPLEEGIYYEIPESNPTFKTLMANNGTGLEGNGVVFSAWARKATGSSSIKLAIWTGESGNPITYYPNVALTSSPSEWTFISQHIPQVTPYMNASGIQSLRFMVLEELHASGDFQLDGATLIPGSKYLAPNVSQTLFNTRMAEFQSRTLLPGEAGGIRPEEGSVVVTNTEYDELGRPKKKYLPYLEACPTNNCNPYFQAESFTAGVLAAANTHYDSDLSDGLPNAGGFAYSEMSYEKDQVTTVDGNGKPGANHHLASGHVGRTFYSGVSTLSPADLTSTPAGSTIPGTLEAPGNAVNPKFAYTHSIDEDGRSGVEWKDGFGRIAQTASVVDKATHQYAVTRNIYDAQGNLRKFLPPMSCLDENGQGTGIADCVDPTLFEYDDENRLVKEINPDAGETRYYYDLLGRVKASQTANQIALGRATISNFDKLGRVIETGEWVPANPTDAVYENIKAAALNPNWPDPQHVTVLSQFFYDKMPPSTPPELADFTTSSGTPILYPPNLQGTFGGYSIGRLCAVITRHPPISALDVDELENVHEVTTKSFSYDKYGRIVETYAFNGFIRDWNLKLQRQSSVYNISGQLIRSLFYNSANSSVADHVAEFHYNSLGQADIISDGVGKILARYSYNQALGKVQAITLDEEGSNPITITYEYDINGGFKEIAVQRRQSGGSSIAIYDQKLFYDVMPSGSTVSPQYGGNIAAQQYSFSSSLGSARGVEYQYDALNRMVNGIYTLMDGATDTFDAAFDEVAGYDNQGRIKYMRRGIKAANTSGGEYIYRDNKNRLAGVNAGMENLERVRVGSEADPIFEYDANGQLVWDKSKDLRITYDFRNMPLEFLYSENGTERRTVLRYDEAGSRVSKLEFNGGQGFRSSLVDNDPTRPQDYASLTEAISSVQSILNSKTVDPGEITINVVVPSYGSEVDIGGSNEFTSLTYNNGTATTPLILVGVVYDSPEYLALVDNRAVGSRWVSAKHYSGLGNEIREMSGASESDQWTAAVLTDMPISLGRWEPGSNERIYYLKNNLGTTVATVNTSATGLSEVYDYFPYGKQKQVQLASTRKITPTFTSKELDEGVDLYYFGARYYDADVGVWISPDKERQYFSPYTFGGNDPINRFDPDGNADIPGKTLAKGNGIEIYTNGTGDVHKPAHAHVEGKGQSTRIKATGEPLKNNPPMSTQQRKLFEANKNVIRNEIKRIGRNSALNEAAKGGGMKVLAFDLLFDIVRIFRAIENGNTLDEQLQMDTAPFNNLETDQDFTDCLEAGVCT